MGAKKAIVLLSGGLDSSLACTYARTSGWQMHAVTFAYGQRAESREIEAAKKIAEWLRAPHEVIDLPWYSQRGAEGALTNTKRSLPRPEREDLENLEKGLKN